MVATISRGKLVWDGTRLSTKQGEGRFVATPPFGPIFEGLDKLDSTALKRKFPYGPIPVPRSESGKDEL